MVTCNKSPFFIAAAAFQVMVISWGVIIAAAVIIQSTDKSAEIVPQILDFSGGSLPPSTPPPYSSRAHLKKFSKSCAF